MESEVDENRYIDDGSEEEEEEVWIRSDAATENWYNASAVWK